MSWIDVVVISKFWNRMFYFWVRYCICSAIKKKSLNSNTKRIFSLHTEYANDKLCNCANTHSDLSHCSQVLINILQTILHAFSLSPRLSIQLRECDFRAKRNNMQTCVIFVITLIRVQHHKSMGIHVPKRKKNYHRSFIQKIFFGSIARAKKKHMETMTQLKWLLLLARFLTVVSQVNERVSLSFDHLRYDHLFIHKSTEEQLFFLHPSIHFQSNKKNYFHTSNFKKK